MSRDSSPKRVTLADVAREAGVSVQTASHVLAENPTVRLPESTRARVRAAAEHVGYRPNRVAQAMKKGRSNVIGVWMPVDRPSLSYIRFLQEIHRNLRGTDFEIMIVAIEGASAFGHGKRLPTTWPVDGILAIDAGKAVGVYREDARNDSTPVCIFGLEEYVNTDSVSLDVMGAFREVTDQLLADGRRDIVHITVDWVLADYPREQRRRGYSEAMIAAGRDPVFIATDRETSSAAERAFEAYLATHPVPDAVLCFHDTFAVGVARVLMDRSVALGSECAVWGYGDYPESEGFRIPISTVATPIPAMVAQGLSWLRDRIENPEIPGRLYVFPMELIHRASSRRADATV